MRQFILGAIAAAGMTGAAMAQEAPILYGDLSPSAENSVSNNEVRNGEATPLPDLGLDFLSTASVDERKSDGEITLKDTMIETRDPNLQGK